MSEEKISDDVEVDSGKKSKPRKGRVIKEVKSLALILLFVMIFRSIFFEPFRIPTGSMIPSLMIGDFILVNKLSYGLKVPFSDIFSDPIYITGGENPLRGDVIVFKYPKDPSINYVKRVVGLPGDEIEILNKQVYINGEPVLVESFSGEKIMEDMDDKFKGFNLKFYKSKTGDHTHVIQQDDDNYYKVDYAKRKIPAGHFFVMGDNRDFSYDSRFWGFVPHRYIKGRAIMVWFSMIFPFGENIFKFRPWRIGTLID